MTVACDNGAPEKLLVVNVRLGISPYWKSSWYSDTTVFVNESLHFELPDIVMGFKSGRQTFARQRPTLFSPG